jgi:hypothetical protein
LWQENRLGTLMAKKYDPDKLERQIRPPKPGTEKWRWFVAEKGKATIKKGTAKTRRAAVAAAEDVIAPLRSTRLEAPPLVLVTSTSSIPMNCASADRLNVPDPNNANVSCPAPPSRLSAAFSVDAVQFTVSSPLVPTNVSGAVVREYGH